MAKAELEATAEPRTPLNRERVLRAAVELADREGVDGLSMRRLSAELGVVPMALYKHVANKDELLDGMIDVGRRRDRPAAHRHRLEDRGPRADPLGTPGAAAPPVGVARDGVADQPDSHRDGLHGLDDRDVHRGRVLDRPVHHVMHAMGSRLMGFTQELFNDQTDPDNPIQPAMLEAMGATYPSIYQLWQTVSHEDASIVGPGCDDQFEFEFALDLMLDGIERLKAAT